MEKLYIYFYRFLIKKGVTLFFLFSFVTVSFYSQNEGFKLPSKVKTDKIKFKLANNLIVVPMTLNGVELSFLLDTGVGSTIIFSLDSKDSLELRGASRIFLRGLGDGEPVQAIKSTNNKLKIGKAISQNHTVYLVLDESINFSPQMGFPIHGIIGYDFFKEFIVGIDYSSRYIKINDPKRYVYKECKKCFETKLDFNDGKRPFVVAKYEFNDELIDIKLLLDSGSGSALWLFENKQKKIEVPKYSFEDFLGKGFNGEIYGRKTKINGLHIGDFVMKRVTTSFPDSIYIKGISVSDRQGSLGGGVLRRFNLIIDYPNKRISFKRNGFFKKPFTYNMSGLTVQHTGIRVAKGFFPKEKKRKPFGDFAFRENSGAATVVSVEAQTSGYRYSLQPNYEVAEVRLGSPAYIAGVKKGDVLLEVNGRPAYNYSLSDLNDLFYSEPGRKIRILIERSGQEIKYVFYLQKVL